MGGKVLDNGSDFFARQLLAANLCTNSVKAWRGRRNGYVSMIAGLHAQAMQGRLREPDLVCAQFLQSIRDEHIREYLRPVYPDFYLPEAGEALRSKGQAIPRQDHDIFAHGIKTDRAYRELTAGRMRLP